MRRSIALLPLALVLSFAAPAFAEETQRVSYVSMQATGEVSVTPDMATVNSGVTSDGKTAREALDANTKAMSDLIAALKELGISEKDLQTSNFSIAPQYVYSDQRDANGFAPPPKILGYQVSNMVTVQVRDLPKLGEFLDKMVTVGANTINGVSFSVADPSKLYDEARKLAFANAKTKAELYGATAGFTLGKITSISENVNYGGPEGYAVKAMDVMADREVPVQAGEMRYSISVNVQWEMAE